MPIRIAGTLSLVAFAACVVAGALVADNTLTTAVLRALYAMAGTFGLGLIVGWMAQQIVRENIRREAERLERRRVELLEQAAAGRESEEGPILTVGG